MSNYVEVTANTYTVHDLKLMEGRIINALNFDLNVITTLQLLEATPTKLSPTSISLSKYVLEFGLLENLGKKHSPAVMVLAAISLADSVYKSKSDLSAVKEAAKVSKE